LNKIHILERNLIAKNIIFYVFQLFCVG